MWGEIRDRQVRRALVAAALVGVALPAAACSSGDGAAADDEADRVAAFVGAAGPDDATFARRGPFAVGVATLDLDDAHRTELFYPADDDGIADVPKVSYDVTSGMSDLVGAALPGYLKIPVQVDAHRDVPASADGPFPVVLFSHAYSGWRTLNATLLADLASWGFVVASTDMPDHRLEALIARQIKPWDPEVDLPVLKATLDRVVDEGMEGGTVANAVDGSQVAVVGHNVGGGDAYKLLASDDRIDVGVSWMHTLPEDVGDKPFMVIAAEGDPTTPDVDADFAKLTGPSRLVVLADSGHSASTDICDGLDTVNGLLGRATLFGFRLPPNVDEAARSGCTATDLAPRTAKFVILHFTVAQLRDAFGLGAPGTGLGPDVVGDLGALVVYQERNISP